MSKTRKKNSKPIKVGKQNNKRGRLIVRNLPFSVTEDSLKNHFVQYGEVNDVNILKKPDGKLVGCGFVQYLCKQNAAKAIHHLSGKNFDGRQIIVDWAVPKIKFKGGNVTQENPKKFPESIDNTTDVVNVKEEEEYESPEYEKNVNKSIMSSDSDNENSDEDIESVSSEVKQNLSVKLKPSHDIKEGKTIFLKNVPFSINNEELKQFMEDKFGPVYYAVICMDPLTEHSKGTAFVKFKEIDTAESCLNGGQKLKINGCVMEAFKALNRNDLNKKEKDKHPDKKKDNRNLYLVKEGVVIAGTSAANGVSMSDMKKRLDLELWKSNMLRNLNMFISRTRLIVHNLPSSYDDKELKLLFKKYSPKNSVIIEVKVMKNMKDIDINGKPTSKGYGFVSFKQHEDALSALRSINNNPSIFNKDKRPIVAFSIENRAVLVARQKRLAKSRMNNPMETEKQNIRPISQDQNNVKKKHSKINNVGGFVGIESKPGVTINLKNKSKLRDQADTHMNYIREGKRNLTKKLRLHQMRNEKKREPKVKPQKPKKKDDFNEREFNKLVNKYRENMPDSFKSWYETG